MSDPTPQLRVRRDVQSLVVEGEAGHKVLEDYARGIASMRELDPGEADASDPRSWRFQAAIHGLPGLAPSLDHPQHWGSCRHNSWFFLPWHRLYLYFFERILQSHIGDDTWALPYWDYSKTGDESSRFLPEPFRTPTTDNALQTDERDPQINDPTDPVPLPEGAVDALAALAHPDFALAPENAASSFGGGAVRDVSPVARSRGAVEGTPHGLVHSFVGGDSGWMGAFETAGLDPIFWLHHANIDRLWEVWQGEHGSSPLPTHPAWVDTEFEFFDGNGSRVSHAVADVLETTNLGYVYESTDPPATPAGVRGLAPAFAGPGGEDMSEPELIGATTDVPLERRATVGVDLEATARPGLVAGTEAEPARWFLRVEDIVGERPTAPAYDIYVNLPEGGAAAAHPERRAGSIASFGIPEATRSDAEHGGLGLTDVFDITGVVAALRDAEDWDGSTLAVTIIPVGVTGEEREGGDVRAGRVSIYAG